MEKVYIDIASQFSQTPGARYYSDGPYSGQEFREKFLVQYFDTSNKVDQIQINLDGTEGFATSFLEEAFGGLARLFGADVCLKKIHFISNDEPYLVDEINQYMVDAE